MNLCEEEILLYGLPHEAVGVGLCKRSRHFEV